MNLPPATDTDLFAEFAGKPLTVDPEQLAAVLNDWLRGKQVQFIYCNLAQELERCDVVVDEVRYMVPDPWKPKPCVMIRAFDKSRESHFYNLARIIEVHSVSEAPHAQPRAAHMVTVFPAHPRRR